MADDYQKRVCQISCGSCCDYWTDVEALCIPAFLEKDLEECPFLTENGCSLPRENRPEECLYYLCEISLAVNSRAITKEEAHALQLQACHTSAIEHWPLEDEELLG